MASGEQTTILRLWLIMQDEEAGYDTYDGAVVCAASEGDARRIHPCGSDDGWGRMDAYWAKDPERVTARMIGTAAPGVPPGVVLASFIGE